MAVDHATDIRRTITGLVLAAIVVLALVLRGWVLLALILLVAALGLWEFFSLFWWKDLIWFSSSWPCTSASVSSETRWSLTETVAFLYIFFHVSLI